MKGHNSNKKARISATLMTGIILAGVMTGSIVNVVNGVGPVTSVQAKELNETVKPQTLSSEKTTEKSTSIKATKEEINKKEVTKEITKKETKATTNKKTKSAVRAGNYVGPSTGAIKTEWDTTKDWASSSAIAFVSPSGSQTQPNDPVLYFGNKTFKFQPSALTNNNAYSDSNKSSWAFTEETGKNPNPRKSYGIIINGAVPSDRGYSATTGDFKSSIEGGVGVVGAVGKITDYHLYKNKAGTGFKATMYDPTYNLSYTFEEMYDADEGIQSYFSITNNATTTREIGAVQGVDTLVDNDTVPVLSLGPNAGFKMVGDAKPLAHTLNYKLKDPKTNAPLGGWTNYTAGAVSAIFRPTNAKYFFKGGILGAGMEGSPLNKEIGIIDISDPDTPMSTLPDQYGNRDSAFVIKANPKALGSGDTLTSGSYLTYKETTPTIPPVATVTSSPTINAYADQTDAFKITGTVKDEDGTKGRIQITYPDGSKSGITENLYDTKTIKTEIPYTAIIDPTKLEVDKANKVTIMAIDDKDNEQTTPVTVTVNLFKLDATAIPQQIDVGGTVTIDETKLIKELTIMNTNKHTLEIDPTNPSNKPLDNTKVGFYMQDMILTDIDVTPNETAKVAVPVTVKDEDTVIDGDSAVYAKDISTDSKTISGLTDAKLKDFILTESSAKGWILSTGADSKVTVKSTTLTPTSSAGEYDAVIVNAQSKEKPIKITVSGGGLAITAASDKMTFGSKDGVMLPYSGEDFNLQRTAENTVSISNLGKKAWTLKASVSKPLTDGSNTLKGVLKYIDATGAAQDLDTGSTEVGSGQTEETKDVTWAADKGVVAELNGSNTSLKAGKYAGEITWTLTDAP